jgi:predicted DNA-binding protein (MmcQ/YjbR family)
MPSAPRSEDLTKPPRNAAAKRLHKAALGYPETREDHPWGERAYKVAGKVFLFLSSPSKDGFSATMKLPYRAEEAVGEPWAEPAGYGMGKHGWVTMRFSPLHPAPIERLLDWLDESYRAVAPKRLAKTRPPGT